MRPTRAATKNAGPEHRGSEKAGRRDVLLQCERCRAIASGRSRDGRLTMANLAVDRLYRHANCGGFLVAYDTGSQR